MLCFVMILQPDAVDLQWLWSLQPELILMSLYQCMFMAIHFIERVKNMFNEM